MDGLIRETLSVSRELGANPNLVLHGGGNTSVKNERFLWAKASGFDLAALDSAGLVRTRRPVLEEMVKREAMSDVAMMDGYREALVCSDDASPTIEALVHHVLPHTSVLHTHADAIVTLTDTRGSENVVHAALGERVLILPFVMPGWALARTIADAIDENGGADWDGIVLSHHGLFTFGDTVAEARDAHLRLVDKAVGFLRAETGVDLSAEYTVHGIGNGVAPVAEGGEELENLKQALTGHGLAEFSQHCDEEVADFLSREDLQLVSQRGPSTLEHVIRTKRVPMLGFDLSGYMQEYVQYYERNRLRATVATEMLSPAPRVVLDRSIGIVTAGASAKESRVAMDIYRHTIRIIEAAERLGGYVTVSEGQAFDIEYWELEQRKLR